MTDTQARASTWQTSWHETVLATLKANDVKLVVYVPDRVFTPLIKGLHADKFFTTFAATREEEALAWQPAGPSLRTGAVGRAA